LVAGLEQLAGLVDGFVSCCQSYLQPLRIAWVHP
jgi:hypothetical protein